MTPPLVLGIETSCDETGVALVRGSVLLGDAVASSVDEHARFGGVVPEVASRAHLEAFVPTLHRALEAAGVRLADVDAVAVTAGPGLAGALLVGVAAAKALALALDVPLYGVNHLVGHVAAGTLDTRGDGGGSDAGGQAGGPLPDPTVALLVSGGHTSLLAVHDLVGHVDLLGETLDDAAGEAFDKVARLLGMPYPGGPVLSAAAVDGDAAAFALPRGMTAPKDRATHRFDFSFSGLKTAVARTVAAAARSRVQLRAADVAASFQEAVVDVLTAKAVDACREVGAGTLLLAGGVAANRRLRGLAAQRCAEAGLQLRVPPIRLCTDNGAMIAAIGALVVAAGAPPSPPGFGADPGLPVTTTVL